MRLTLVLPLVLLLIPYAGFAAKAQGIKGFCAAAQKHVQADARLSAAVETVFGHPAYGMRSDQDAACIYPLQVLRFSSADVLLTIGNAPGEACHGCAASLSAYVLARQGGGLKLVNRAVDFGTSGTSGDPGAISAIRIGNDDGMVIESGGTFQGHSSSVLEFYAFHGGRVVHVEANPRIYLSASDNGSITGKTPVTDVTGSWAVVAGAAPTLRIDYRVSYGRRTSSAAAVWTLLGERWTLTGGRIPPELKHAFE